MDELRQAIEDALHRRGLSASAASQMAAGNPSVIKNLMNRRASGDAVRSHPIDNLVRVAEVLGLELYLGPPRPAPKLREASVEVDGVGFSALPIYDAEVSAGPGRSTEAVEVVGLLAFSHLWLQKQGIEPARACLVRVHGDSMIPTFVENDLLLIDGARTEIVRGRVYALVDIEGDTRVKRLERIEHDTLALRSDNPSHPLELRRGPDLDRLRIIGEVRWSGHTWR